MFKHRHVPLRTGLRVTGWFQKDNQPRGEKSNPLLSNGDEARCIYCNVRLIIHDHAYPNAFTELSETPVEDHPGMAA